MPVRIAIITDIHANLPALQAALQAIKAEGCDALIHTGDAIAIGPYPAECLDLLSAQPTLTYIMGNHDAYFAHRLLERRPAWMEQEEYDHQQWTHASLSAHHRSLIEQWPYVVQTQYEDVAITLLHYGLASNGRKFLSIIHQPQPADLDQLFAPYAATSDLIFYGHHHPYSDLQGRARYVNPGSLGCYTEPIARYALLEVEHKRWTIQHRSIPYDDADLWSTFERRDVPGRELIWQRFFGGRKRA